MRPSYHEKILEIQSLALEKLATGKSITEILDTLTLGAEKSVKGCYSLSFNTG